MIEAISRILGRCESIDTVMPPTALFNEGWLLRLVLDWSDRHRQVVHPLSFSVGASWYSEALLPSRFLQQRRGDSKAESYTHADGIIGHFDVASERRSKVKLRPNTKQFVVLEAKLGSGLSKGTKNAPNYDQAARNVACMAYMLGNAGINPNTIDRLAFHVLAPVACIKSGVFADLVTKSSIKRKVQERVSAYTGKHDAWFQDTFLPTLERIELDILAWEDILSLLPKTIETELMSDFYMHCRRFAVSSLLEPKSQS